MRVRATLGFALVLGLGCDADFKASSPSVGELCLTPAVRQLTTNPSGAALKAAVDDHVPTEREVSVAAAFWLIAAEARETGRFPIGFYELHQEMVRIAVRYPSLVTSDCPRSSTQSLFKAVRTGAPGCKDNCEEWGAISYQKAVLFGVEQTLGKVASWTKLSAERAEMMNKLHETLAATRGKSYGLAEAIDAGQRRDMATAALACGDFVASLFSGASLVAGYIGATGAATTLSVMALVVGAGVVAIDLFAQWQTANLDVTDCLRVQIVLCPCGPCVPPSVCNAKNNQCEPPKDCPGGCPSGSLCVKETGSSKPPYCSKICKAHTDCTTRCCLSYNAGAGKACAAANLCACPPGTFPLDELGSCVAKPTSCPNGWVVCTCPEAHGAWCHEDMKYGYCP